MVAEAQAAEAEAAQDAAVHRELAALEAAEAAEEFRREAVARLAQDRESAAEPDGAAPSTVDLRPASSQVAPAVETATRRPLVAPLEPGRGRAGGAGTGHGDEGDEGDEPEVRPSVPDSIDAAERRRPARPAAGPASATRSSTEPPPDEPLPSDGAEVADLPVVAPRGAGRRRAGRQCAPSRCSSSPVAVLLRTALAPSSWSGIGIVEAVLLVVAAVLTVLGVAWTWRATTPPYALRRRTARRIVASEQQQLGQTGDAARMLAKVGEGTADQAAWDDFEQRTGLVVPGAHPDRGRPRHGPCGPGPLPLGEAARRAACAAAAAGGGRRAAAALPAAGGAACVGLLTDRSISCR